MHLLIPFANCNSEACTTERRRLRLPHLEKLLARLAPGPLISGDEFSLSTPHERVLARALGLPLTDGLIPWAALQAQPAEGAWGFIAPCHWRAGGSRVAMTGVEMTDFSANESKALLAAMQPYFEEDGISLHYRLPGSWLARSELFAELATASLDRVLGRDIANWLPQGPGAARLRRLQAEMQMLLHTHPVNEARQERGLQPINSFWLTGTGVLAKSQKEVALEAHPIEIFSLREAALHDDWPAWSRAWQTLDKIELSSLLMALKQGGNIQLTLCGERNAQTFYSTQSSTWKGLKNLFNGPAAKRVLEAL
jgi:hypothetical protein